MRRAIGRRLVLARIALSWERVWPAVWPATIVLGGFLVLALIGLWSRLPGWLHLAGLVLFAAAFGAGVWRGLRDVAWPSNAEAKRRLERSSGIAHRPLAVLTDRLASGAGDPQSAALWQLHRERARAVIRRLRVGLPAAGLARRDPWAVRAVLGLFLVVALAGAGGDGGRRLVAAFKPDFSGPAARPAELEAWLTPPAYTAVPPLFLTARDAESGPLRIPEGSTLLARLSGGRGAPVLDVDGALTPFVVVDASAHQLEHVVDRARRIAVIQGQRELRSWDLDIVVDRPPTVTLAEQPSPTPRQALKIMYQASDDYGLTLVKASIRRASERAVAKASDDERIEVVLPLAGVKLKQAEETSYHDLTAHPWAGLPVRFKLVATDARNQAGESEEIELVLPQRVFHQPVAKALVEQRRMLSHDPENRDRVAEVLAAISLLPVDYFEDVVVHLALRSAQRRLLVDPRHKAISEVQELLWDTALRLEDGNASLAELELREAQRALLDALARDAPDEEVARLMDRLQRALANYLEALAEQSRRMAERGAPPVDPNGIIMRGDELQRMLDRARALSEMGAREAARRLLSELQSILERLRAGAVGDPSQQAIARAMRGLGELMNKQQDLLDQTFRSFRQGRPESGLSYGSMADRQKAMRRALGEIMRQIGEADLAIPRTFGRAERAMRGAREALDDAQPGEAVGPQSEALEHLREGAGEMLRAMIGEGGFFDGEFDYAGAEELARDPFGRISRRGRTVDDGRVKIPDESDIQRARTILDELYRRAGQRSRPTAERDYIDRLLRRF